MIIREMSHNELLSAIKFEHDSWYDDNVGVILNTPINLEKEITYITEWLNDTNSENVKLIYGAYEQDNFCGYISGCFADKNIAKYSIELCHLFVKKEFRGLSISLKLLKTILIEFKKYNRNQLILYNFHNSKANSFYMHLKGQVLDRVIENDVPIDIFTWEINSLLTLLDNKLGVYEK